MAKKILLIILIALFIFPLINAATTDIHVKTKPAHQLLIVAQKAGVFPPERIQSFAPYKDTGNLGEVKVSLITTESTVDLKLELIKNDNTPDINNFYANIPTTGEPVYINFLPGNFTYTVGNPIVVTKNTDENLSVVKTTSTNETNETKKETIVPQINKIDINKNNISIKSNNSNNSITGYAVGLYGNAKNFGYLWTVIGVIVGILIIIFVIRKIPRSSFDKPVRVNHKPYEFSSFNSNPSLTLAEKKLKEAQSEIESIKRRHEEIRNAERKLEEDRIRLDRLRRGY